MAAKKSSKAKASASKVTKKTGKKKAAAATKKASAAKDSPAAKAAKTVKKSVSSAKSTSAKTTKKAAASKKKAGTASKSGSKKGSVSKAGGSGAAKSTNKPSKKKTTASAAGGKKKGAATKTAVNGKVENSAKPVAKQGTVIPAALAKKLPPIKKLASPFRTDSEPARVVREDREWTVDELKKVKTGLSRKDLTHFKDLLLERRAEIIGSVTGMETARADRSEGSSSMPLHMADIGSENFDEEFNLGLMESERKLLKEINEAIQRINEGYYGVCLESGEPINRERLEAKPWAKYTIEVARDRERRGLSSG